MKLIFSMMTMIQAVLLAMESFFYSNDQEILKESNGFSQKVDTHGRIMYGTLCAETALVTILFVYAVTAEGPDSFLSSSPLFMMARALVHLLYIFNVTKKNEGRR